MLRLTAGARALVLAAAVALLGIAASPSRAAFHLWALHEVYTNSSGALQFIELQDDFGGQNSTSGQQIDVFDGTTHHTFTLPSSLPGDTTNHNLLLGTAGLQGAGGPAPDFIIPNGFLFAGGATISFFGFNGGAYSSLPTDGV